MAGHARRFVAGWLLGLGVLAGAAAQPSDPDLRPTLTLERPDKTIEVILNDEGAAGARFIASNANCEEGVTLGIVYAPEPGFVETIVGETRITSSIALLRKPSVEGEGGRETLELLDGTLTFDERRCPQNIEASENAEVVLNEGRTTVVGTGFDYDNATGLGVMAGPVDLSREAAGDSPGLDATANSLEFNADTEISVLRGGVQVTSEDRSSQADTLDYDEDAGIASMRGDPAVSEQGENRVEGRVITYYLDSNDVLVRGGVGATLEYDQGGEAETP